MSLDAALVTLTPPAADKLREVVAAQQAFPAEAGLRVGVVHGGCSGFQYHLALDVAAEGDRVVEHDGLRLLVGDDSVRYVDGSSIDFVDAPGRSGFVVDNPNAIAGCGCGSSFVLRDDA
ncbi:MAG: iron-sulfur cluster assembly accessory protein [Solirubrobacterales bacterium]|nr:iron-sulfur cluster assembly accessory protein [Solirubrobacterales bacterium]